MNKYEQMLTFPDAWLCFSPAAKQKSRYDIKIKLPTELIDYIGDSISAATERVSGKLSYKSAWSKAPVPVTGTEEAIYLFS